MAIIYGCINEKGGVGKSTTVASLCASLAEKGKKVLGVDLDPQSSLTISLGFRGTYPSTINDLFLSRVQHQEPAAIEPLRHAEGMDILPSCGQLAHTSTLIGSVIGRERILKKYLDTVQADYDYILIDCPPTLSHLTVNAMTAADEIIIPVEADYLSVQGMQRLFSTFQEIRENMNSNLKIGGILITMHDPRSNFAREMANRLRLQYGHTIPVLKPAIPKSIKVVEASAQGQSILAYASSNPVAEAYRQIGQALLRRERGRERQQPDRTR